MPDTLPPLRIPDELIASPNPAMVKHDGEWAQRVGRGDTSLAQRVQHNTDLAAYAAQLQAAQETHQQQALARDAGARALYFKQLDLERQREAAQAKAAIDAANQQRAAELHPLKLKLLEQQAAAAHELESARVNTEAHKALTDKNTAEQIARFKAAAMEAAKNGIGTPLYHEKVTQASTQVTDPAALKALHDEITHSRGEHAKTVARESAANAAENAGLKVTGYSASGAPVYSQPDKPLTAAQKELATHREIRRLQSRDSQLGREMQTTEKHPDAAKWMGTTGLEPASGMFRFADESTTKPYKPSEAELSQYQAYTSAAQERRRIGAQLAQHESALNAGIADAPPAIQPPPAAAPEAATTAASEPAVPSDERASAAAWITANPNAHPEQVAKIKAHYGIE